MVKSHRYFRSWITCLPARIVLKRLEKQPPRSRRHDLGDAPAGDDAVTTTEAAKILDVSAEFVRGEIEDGRMDAQIIRRPGKRTVYRLTREQLDAYCRRWGWGGVPADYQEPIPRSSLCHERGCKGIRQCRACRNIYSRVNRKKYSELDPVQRRKADVRRVAGMAQKRGKLTPSPCEVCGSTDVQKHHDDYAKPLEVRWLCPVHHREADRNKPTQPIEPTQQ